jgi:putative membrane protein
MKHSGGNMIKLFLSTAIAAFAFSAFADVETDMTGKQMPQLSDAEIVQIVLNLNAGEVASSKIALKKTSRADVRDFAKKMMDAHRMNTVETQRLAVKYNIKILPSSISRDLQTLSKTIARELKQKSGNDFDKDYINHQVMMHENALKMLNEKLIPRARSVALKTHLENTREAVITHLGDARKISDQLIQ